MTDMTGMPSPQMGTAPGAPPGVQLPEGVQVKPLNTQAIVDEVKRFYEEKAQDRKPYEMDWFLNAAAVRTGSEGKFHPIAATLEPASKNDPPHRRRVRINRVRVKYLAKIAKYVNPRQRLSVIAASEDREDVLDARGTQSALLYLTRKLALESKFEKVVAQAELTGKSFLGYRWNADTLGTIRDPRTGEPREVQLGDVEVYNSSAFNILVDDSGLETLGEQPRMMEVTVEPLDDVLGRFPELQGKIEGDAGVSDLFQFQKQIAALGAKYSVGGSSLLDSGSGGTRGEKTKKKDFVIRKQMFWKPTAAYPRGRYALVFGNHLVKFKDQLPYQFYKFTDNPYPFTEFTSTISAGQFWPPTMVENLRPIAANYQELRSRIKEHLMSNGMFGKLLVPRRAKVATNAWNSEPNEKVYYDFIPGMPAPHVAPPPQLSSDVWRTLDYDLRDMDDISNIPPASLGLGVDTESGYQANVLQEANDAVFQPDRARMQRSLVEMYLKIRKLMAIGYTEDRLIQVGGRSQSSAMQAFSQANIDEHAEIEVQIGSALPDGKAARLQSIMELKGTGLFGDAENPRVRRGILDMVDLGGVEHDVDPEYQDAERARLENLHFSQGIPVMPPLDWQNDNVHIAFLQDFLNSNEFDLLPLELKMPPIEHWVLHMRKVDPARALSTAQMFANQSPLLMQLVPELTMAVQQMMMAAQPATGGPGGPQGGNAPGAPAPGAPFSQASASSPAAA